MKAEILVTLSQAIATLAGAVFVLIGIWYRERLESATKSKSARIQIAAEVRSLLDLIELNGFVPAIQTYVERLREGKFLYLNFYSNRNVMAVYQANLANLGYLEASAADVVRFYMIVNSVLEDKDTIVDLGRVIEARLAAGGKVTPEDLTMLVRRHEMFQVKLLELVRLGEKICNDLHFRPKNVMRLALPKAPARGGQPASVASAVAEATRPTVH